MIKNLLLFICVLSPFTIQAKTLPKANLIPGGIAVITLSGQYTQRPNVQYQSKSVFVMEQEKEGQWTAIVGIPLAAANSQQTLTINQTQKQHFQVGDKSYPEERLTITNKKMVNPDKSHLERIQKEYQQLRQALSSFDSETHIRDFNVQLPTQGRFSSPFGLQRFYNNEPRSPHSGLDIAAPTGQTVQAALDGKVIIAGHFYFNGNTVVVDHGQGFKTLYCHLNEITTKVGERVSKGDTVGKVGSTGRVTGPHLHWTVVFNNTKVDPTLLL